MAKGLLHLEVIDTSELTSVDSPGPLAKGSGCGFGCDGSEGVFCGFWCS